MKYDSGMTQFHKDIIAALRYMLKDDSEITEKFRPKDGSPAPLRDYLKLNYGKPCSSHVGNGMRYSCNFSKGFELTSDTILNNPGDKKLTLSWSQVTKFIRDNWDGIFKPEADAGENVPKEKSICDDCINNDENCIKPPEDKCIGYTSESDTILNPAPEGKPTYKDIFLEHYPDFDVSRFDEFINSNCRYACAVEYFTDTDSFDCNNPQNCKKCWYSPCEGNWNSPDFVLEDISDYLKTVTVPENESPEEIADKTAVSIQDKNTEIQTAFDYSELDGDTAKNLRDCETVIRQETAGYFTLLGAKFKEARELLANHANGTFEKWYTAMGFKRQTVYNLIQRYDFLGSPTIGGREDTFETLPPYPVL